MGIILVKKGLKDFGIFCFNSGSLCPIMKHVLVEVRSTTLARDSSSPVAPSLTLTGWDFLKEPRAGIPRRVINRRRGVLRRGQAQSRVEQESS